MNYKLLFLVALFFFLPFRSNAASIIFQRDNYINGYKAFLRFIYARFRF